MELTEAEIQVLASIAVLDAEPKPVTREDVEARGVEPRLESISVAQPRFAGRSPPEGGDGDL